MNAVRRFVVGLVALAVIVAIIVGLPVVLIALGANPLDATLPSWDEVTRLLTSPDDGTLAVGLIKVVAWLAWAFLTVSLLVEIVSRMRGLRAPRMPGLKLPQAAARGLVGAVVVMFVTMPMAQTAHASEVPVHDTGVVAQAIEQHQAAERAAEQAELRAEQVRHEAEAQQQAEHAARAADKAAQPRTHTVERGESLWSIAESRLGDGHRYTEIVALNADLLDGKASFLSVGWELRIPPAADAAPEAPAEAKSVTVVKGDTLSQIAADELGDASRYPEIFEASKDIEQPGGARLTDADVIDVGWTVHVPGAQAESAPADAAAQPAEEPAPEPPAPVEQPAPVDLAGAAGAEAGSGADGGVGAGGFAGAEARPGGADLAAADESAVVEQDAPVLRSAAGVGAVLAAGILVLLGVRRRNQQRLRRPGQQLPATAAAQADVEADLHAAADPLTIQTVDVALRSLARACGAAGRPLPVVRAARLTPAAFTLYLGESAALPEPWSGNADGTIWDLDAGAARTATVDASTPAPYPALVTVGHDDTGHLFVNLEELGGLDVVGQERPCRELLGSLALELALSTWADDLQVTVVGAFADLENSLGSGRIRSARSVDRVLDDVAARVERDRRALTSAGLTDVGQARATGALPDAWTPEVVIVVGPITDTQRDRFAALVAGAPRAAVAVVTTGAATTPWTLDLDEGSTPEHALLAPIGLELRPQKLPTERYGHLLRLLESTDLGALQGEPVREPSLAEVETIAPVDEPDDETHLAAPRTSAPPATASPATGTAPAPDEQSAGGFWDTRATSASFWGTGAIHAGASGPAGDVEPAEGDDATHVAAPRPHAVPDDDATRVRNAVPPPSPPAGAPRVTVLGPVAVQHATGAVAPAEQARLVELAAYLALHPGADEAALATALGGPGGADVAATRTALSRLRRWFGTAPDGAEHLPRHADGTGYALHPAVSADVADWDRLVAHRPTVASTQDLEAALDLVDGVPFAGTHQRRYGWAEPERQRLVAEIVDAAYELARRRIYEGRWRAAERAVTAGLRVEPAQESLWRMRILAAHQSRDADTESRAVHALLSLTEQLACDPEPQTARLLAELRHPGGEFDRIMAGSL